jgi:spore germination protein PB
MTVSTNFFVNQSIVIHYLRIEGISNSSVLQIGSAGIIKPVSHLYNTGGFTGPAPEAEVPAPTKFQPAAGTQQPATPAVPLGGTTPF